MCPMKKSANIKPIFLSLKPIPRRWGVGMTHQVFCFSWSCLSGRWYGLRGIKAPDWLCSCSRLGTEQSFNSYLCDSRFDPCCQFCGGHNSLKAGYFPFVLKLFTGTAIQSVAMFCYDCLLKFWESAWAVANHRAGKQPWEFSKTLTLKPRDWLDGRRCNAIQRAFYFALK